MTSLGIVAGQSRCFVANSVLSCVLRWVADAISWFNSFRSWHRAGKLCRRGGTICWSLPLRNLRSSPRCLGVLLPTVGLGLYFWRLWLALLSQGAFGLLAVRNWARLAWYLTFNIRTTCYCIIFSILSFLNWCLRTQI